MGVDLSSVVEFKEIELESLTGKRIAIDAMNSLYQFLSIIRQRDGTPLMDSDGNITSHLSGLFYRTARMLENGILPAYVFDGKPPKLKHVTIEGRSAAKKAAHKKWAEAVEEGDLEKAKRFAQRTSKLTPEMVEECKKLLDALGVPWVQAPSEGEAQAAFICSKGEAWAVGSQDFDSFLFGAPRLVRNITISGRRKVPRKEEYIYVKPEIGELEGMLKSLDVTREQLIDIAILVGTDFNEGVKGIGPKKALALIKEKGLEKATEEEGFTFEVDPNDVRNVFLKPELTKDYKLKWSDYSPEKILEILSERHEFSEERINSSLEKLEKASHAKDQQSLDKWL